MVQAQSNSSSLKTGVCMSSFTCLDVSFLTEQDQEDKDSSKNITTTSTTTSKTDHPLSTDTSVSSGDDESVYESCDGSYTNSSRVANTTSTNNNTTLDKEKSLFDLAFEDDCDVEIAACESNVEIDGAIELLANEQEKKKKKGSVASVIDDNNNHDDDNDDDSMTIMGIFERSKGIYERYEEEKEKNQLMGRQKLITRPIDEPYDDVNLYDYSTTSKNGDTVDVACIIPHRGFYRNKFWHLKMFQTSHGILEERALLVNSHENYKQLLNSNIPIKNATTDDVHFKTSPIFGEQLLIEGYSSSQIAIGDVFEVKGKLSPLVLQVTSPRLPGPHVEARNGRDVALYCLNNACGGWFMRVITAGELRNDMKLERTKHPHPKWTISYLIETLYGKNDENINFAKYPASWTRSREELEELVNLPELAKFEWKVQAEKLLSDMDVGPETDEPETKSFPEVYVNNLWYYARRSKQIATSPITNLIWPERKMTVMGLFKKVPAPRTENLPSGWTYNHKGVCKDQVFPRRRMKTRPIGHEEDENDCSYETAHFVPIRGLEHSSEFWNMYNSNKYGILEDRAILFQSTEHYDKIMKDPKFKNCFKDEDYMQYPTFGEQIIVQGINSSQLAVGDVFEVEDGLSSLVVEITSPRLPCYAVDKRHDTKGLQGMKRHVMTYGLGGWFTRVLVAGELREGMNFIRISHPHPKYTLTYLCKVLYSEGNRMQLAMGKAHWTRSKNELVEITKLPQLANFEWKDEAIKLLEKMEEKEKSQNKYVCTNGSLLPDIACFDPKELYSPG